MPARLDIEVYVGGQEQIDALKSRLAKLQEQTDGMRNIMKKVELQYRAETEEIKQNNKVLEKQTKLHDSHITDRAKQLNMEEDYTTQIEHRLRVERMALRTQESESKKGIAITMEEARRRAEDTLAFETEQQRKQQALMHTRRALMQASISMFVLNISANQMLSSLKPLVKGNVEYTKALEGMQATLNMSLGPMQFYMSMQQMMINMSNEQKTAVGGLVGSLGTLYFIYAMLTTKSKELKVLFGAMIGLSLALTLRTIALAKAKWMENVAVATGQSLWGNMSGWVKIAIGMAIAGAVMGAVAGMVSFQTLPGRSKFVKSSQVAQLHSGEEVRRPILANRMGGDAGGMTIHLHFDRGTSKSDASYITQTVKQAINSGSIRKYSRAVGTG